MVRDSLLGAHVQPMTVDQRAELLAGVAGDCVAKVLAAGFELRSAASRQAEDTWNTFQSLRKTYFFGDDAPSIIFYKDIIHLLPKYTSSNHQALARAVELCNLATFAYVILNPDYAGRLASGSNSSRKGKERARDPSMVEKRNSVLLNIWEKYWQIIPESEKASEEAMRMWLALATQIVIHYQSFEVDPSSVPDQGLQPPSREVWDQIFHPSAVARFGQWGLPGSQSTDGSGIDGMTQEIVEARWAKAIKIRANELSRLQIGTLIKRYPYDEFRRNMFAYLDSDIVGAAAYLNVSVADDSVTDPTDDGNVSSATETQRVSVPPRRSIRHRSSTVLHPQRTTLDVTDEELEPGDLADAEEDTDMEAAEAFVGGMELDNAVDDDAALDSQILADVVREMETEGLVFTTRDNGGTPRPGTGPSSTSVTPSKRRRAKDVPEEDDWEVNVGRTPRALTAQQVNPLMFNFATRQANAVQVDWESQSPARQAGKGSNARQTIPVGHEVESSMPVLDAEGGLGLVPAGASDATPSGSSATPRRTRGPMFPSRSQDRPHSDMRSRILPDTLREASVPLVTDYDFVEEEEVVEGESQERLVFDAAEEIGPDVDVDGNDLLPTEVLNRRFLPHRTKTHAKTAGLSTTTAGRGHGEADWAHGSRETHRNVSSALFVRGGIADDSSDDALSLLPPEILVRTNVDRFRSAPVEDTEPAGVADDGSSATEDEGDDDLLPSELARATATRDTLRPVTNLLLAGGADEESDGNELLPLEAIRQNQLGAFRPGHVAETNGEIAPPVDQQSQAYDGHFEQIAFDDVINSSLVPQSPSQVRAGQDALALNPETGMGGDHDISDITMEQDHVAHHIPALASDFGIDGQNRESSSQRGATRSEQIRDVDEHGFVVADEAEDEEDRLLLQEIDQNRAARRPSTPLVDVKPYDRVVPRFQARTRSLRDSDIDLYVVDEDGSPLHADETYRIPPDYVPRLSRLHGQVAGQSTAYSRLSGKKRWTEEQALLLYRTLQKVPLDLAYPLRVVWYLHGEHGFESQRLEDFNPQHMKDKMVTMLKTRTNNRLPVEGRARMYLPRADVRRQEYDQELLEWEEERKRADRAARDELDRLEAERKAAEDGSDEDAEGETDEAEGEAEDAMEPPRRSSRSSRRKRQSYADEKEDNDDGDEDDGDDEDGDNDNNNGGDDAHDENDNEEGVHDNRDDIELGSEYEDPEADHGSKTRVKGRKTRSGGSQNSRPSTRSTQAIRTLAPAKASRVQNTDSQPKRKRGRPRKDDQQANGSAVKLPTPDEADATPQGADGQSRSSKRRQHHQGEQDVDVEGQDPASKRTVRSTSFRGRLMAEVVLPSRSNPTMSKPHLLDGPIAPRSATKTSIKRSRAAVKPKKRNIPYPVTDSASDSESEIDGLIDGEAGGHAAPEDVGMPAMSDLESEEGDHVVGKEVLPEADAGEDQGEGGGDEGPEQVDEVGGEEAEAKAKAAHDAEAEETVRRRLVQQKVLEGAD